MRRVAFGFAVIGIVTAVFLLFPRYSGGKVLYVFRFLPTKSPAYYQAAETALGAWLMEKGFARVPPDDLTERRYEAPATPPMTVVLKNEPSGQLRCTFDWSYQDFSWFESEDHLKARAFSADLKLWRDRYLRQHP